MNNTITSLPTVTIIMPIYNAEHYIRESLSAILAQDYPADKIEILIADGMSSDNTRAIIDHPYMLMAQMLGWGPIHQNHPTKLP